MPQRTPSAAPSSAPAAASGAYEKATFQTVWALMSPNTWVAALAPVPVGAALAFGLTRAGYPTLFEVGLNTRSLGVFLLMLVTATLMQSAANALNDYADFKKGTDTAENSVDLADVPLVSSNVDPRTGLHVAIGCLVAAAFTGGLVVAIAGWTLLWIGLIGAVTVVLYSSGKTPLSFLPLGEVISGSVMGLLIPFATYYALTGVLEWIVLLYALPTFLTIAMIMQTNNTCDIERDTAAGRRTAPMLLGAKLSAGVMAAAHLIAWLTVGAVVGTYFPWGLPLVGLGVFFAGSKIVDVLMVEYTHLVRPESMKRAVSLTALNAAVYVAAIVIGAIARG